MIDATFRESIAILAAMRDERGDLTINPDDDALQANKQLMESLLERFGGPPYPDVEEYATAVTDNQLAKLEVAIMQGEQPKEILWQLFASSIVNVFIEALAYKGHREHMALEQAIADAQLDETDEEDDDAEPA